MNVKHSPQAIYLVPATPQIFLSLPISPSFSLILEICFPVFFKALISPSLPDFHLSPPSGSISSVYFFRFHPQFFSFSSLLSGYNTTKFPITEKANSNVCFYILSASRVLHLFTLFPCKAKSFERIAFSSHIYFLIAHKAPQFHAF